MKIYEEFLQRNRIVAPMCHHVHSGYYYFRRRDGGKLHWRVLEIKYVRDESHPSTYKFQWCIPVHSSNRDQQWQIEDAATDVGWDQYEERLVAFVKGLSGGYKPIMNTDEALLTTWEIFAYNYDDSLARYATNDCIFRSLDVDLPLADRLAAVQESAHFLQSGSSGLTNSWLRTFAGSYLHNYAFWLTPLVS